MHTRLLCTTSRAGSSKGHGSGVHLASRRREQGLINKKAQRLFEVLFASAESALTGHKDSGRSESSLVGQTDSGQSIKPDG